MFILTKQNRSCCLMMPRKPGVESLARVIFYKQRFRRWVYITVKPRKLERGLFENSLIRNMNTIDSEKRGQFIYYCKFGNFREKFILANSVKRHICDVKTFRFGHDLLISVNDRVILPFLEAFIFTKLRICEVSRK